ncbi:hypothetical protein BVF91_12990 [Thermoanaerobacterium sp. PSU-2]|uniref:YopX family protein n=1 Tax=Thermoanaerobacterium sp. PSU-2 TaxID=1930849 RepID=UPI000A16A5D5|nr:YopX family protein [Thermoanaerobacterium sp. PSU-2]ORX22202.1 hypothetical protein BVF91_12990 [Thermoanaerobacterium sp. PSU-2]
MREIKFRGKRKDNGEWMYGYVVRERYGVCIQYLMEKPLGIEKYKVVVEPESVGQYTGLKDKNGQEIYEGDIVVAEDSYGNKWCGVVKYKDKHTAFFVEGKNVAAILGWHLTDNNGVFAEVIGNIYENPELLEG